MKIVYRVSEQDFMAAQELFVASESWYRRTSLRLKPWLGGLLIAMQVVYFVTVPDRNLPLLVFGALLGAYFLCRGLAAKKFFRRLYRKDQRFQHDFIADISKDGIHISTPTEDSQMKWASFVRFLESDKIFMLFHAQWIFNVLPKAAFTSSEVEEFRDLLRHNIPAAKE